MRVIADLHGGDPEDLVARAEFQEIKERVMFEVSRFPIPVIPSLMKTARERRRPHLCSHVEKVQASCTPCHVLPSIRTAGTS